MPDAAVRFKNGFVANNISGAAKRAAGTGGGRKSSKGNRAAQRERASKKRDVKRALKKKFPAIEMMKKAGSWKRLEQKTKPVEGSATPPLLLSPSLCIYSPPLPPSLPSPSFILPRPSRTSPTLSLHPPSSQAIPFVRRCERAGERIGHLGHRRFKFETPHQTET